MADGGLLTAHAGGLPVDPAADCAQLLIDLAAQEATGCLLLVHPSGEASEVYLKNGLVYAVFVPGRRPMLGSRLMSSGELAPEALAEALEIQRTELQGWRLGELLVHLGYVDRAVVEAFVCEQLLDMATDLLGAGISSYRFRAKKLTRQDVAPPITVADLLDAARARRAEWGQLAETVGGAQGVPRLATSAPASSDVVLGPDDWAMLCKVDGARTLAELAEDCGLTVHEAGRQIASLTAAGLVEVDLSEDATAPVASEAVDQELAEAFAAVADAWSGPSAGEQAAEAEATRWEHEQAAAAEERQAQQDAEAAAIDPDQVRHAQELERRKAEAQALALELEEAAARQGKSARKRHEAEERAHRDAQEAERREAEEQSRVAAEQARAAAEQAAADEARRAEERRRATAAVVRWLSAELAQAERDEEAREEAAWRTQADWFAGVLAARREAQRIEAERIEAEHAAAEAARLAAEAEAARLAAAQAEAARLETERLEAERIAAEQAAAEAARVAAEQAEAERLAAERLETERLAAEQAEAVRIETERIAAERAGAQAEAARLEAERIAAEQADAEAQRAAAAEAERAEAARVAAEMESARVAAEQAAAEAARVAAEQAEAERIEAERIEAEAHTETSLVMPLSAWDGDGSVAAAFAELNEAAESAPASSSEPDQPDQPDRPDEPDRPPAEALDPSAPPPYVTAPGSSADHFLAAAPSQAVQAEMLDTAALLRELASLNGDGPAPPPAPAPAQRAPSPGAAAQAKKRRLFGL